MIEQFVHIKDNDDGTMLVYWLEPGGLRTIPQPKFFNGQFVKTSPKHCSQKNFTRVAPYCFTDVWKYTEEFTSRGGLGGGSRCCLSENRFEPLTDPLDILIAEKLTLEIRLTWVARKKKAMMGKLNSVKSSIEIIESALGAES